MKKKILALLLSCCLFLSAAPVAAAYEYTPTDKRDILYGIIEFLQTYALDGSEDDDPLYAALEGLFEQDPAAYEILMANILSQYDSHTMYIPAGYYDTAFPETDSYVGIGVTIQADEAGLLVTGLDDRGSAALAGVQAGDVIVAVDGVSLAGKSATDAAALLRGEQGTWVTVTINRAGQKLTFRLMRITIGDANFSGYLLEDGVYYMKWARISTLSSYLDFVAACQDMADQGARSLILDLRDDPGGELNMGFSIVDRLLPDAVDYFRIGHREGTEMKYETLTSSGMGARLNKIIILSNENSASASEVIQCGLVDTGYAVAVGAPTYGKARAQYHLTLDDDSAAVVTVYQLCSISRPDYEGTGLEPDYLVLNEYGASPAASCDPVPETALPLGCCSDNCKTLNLALQALGYLGHVDKLYLFSADTQTALMRLCYDNGLVPAASGMTGKMAKLVNACLKDKAANGMGVVDWQFQKALELAREYAKQPAQYSVDDLGNIVNQPKQ